MNPIPVCKALVDALIAFEHSSPSEMDPEFAIRTMEHLTSSLLELDPSGQRELRNTFLEIASTSHDVPYGDFVKSVPDMLGLAE